MMAGFNLFLITCVAFRAACGFACSNMFSDVSFHSDKIVDCRHKKPSVAQLLWIDELNFCSGILAAGRTRSETLWLRDASKRKKRWLVVVVTESSSIVPSSSQRHTGFHAA